MKISYQMIIGWTTQVLYQVANPTYDWDGE